MNWFKKLVSAPSGQTVNLEGLETWMVSWTSRHGVYSCDTRLQFQAFTNSEDAEHFAQSLRDAFRLVKHTAQTDVRVERQS